MRFSNAWITARHKIRIHGALSMAIFDMTFLDKAESVPSQSARWVL